MRRELLSVVLLFCICLLSGCGDGQQKGLLMVRDVSMTAESNDDYIYDEGLYDEYGRKNYVEVHLRPNEKSLKVEVCGDIRIIYVKRKHVACKAKDNRLIVTTRDVENYWSRRVNGVEVIKLSFEITPIVRTDWVWELNEYEAASIDLSNEGLAFAADGYRVYVLKD